MPEPAPRCECRSRRLRLAVGLFISLAVCGPLGSEDESDDESKAIDIAETGVERPFVGMDLGETEPLTWEAVAVPRTKRSSARSELTPAEVIDHPDCGMRIGAGAAFGLAMVVVPDAIGARFSVLNEDGAVQSGDLPFAPYRYMMGKRSDGSIVAGFGRLAPEHGVNQGRENPGPLRIYLDGQLIDAREGIRDFGVANDGSSYWLVEPLGEGSSRLAVRNLDEGTERHHDLGDKHELHGFDMLYGMSYTPNGNELHVAPVNDNESGEGVHYFFPVSGGGQARKLRVEGIDPWDRAYIVSSTEGYFFFTGDESEPGFRVEKRRFDWATGEISAVWGLGGASGATPSPIQATPDGAWLLFETHPAHSRPGGRSSPRSDWALYVLDASTGEPAFALPTVDEQAQLARLQSVLGSGADIEDMGYFNRARIDSGLNQLIIDRRFETDGEPDYDRRALDVYDLDTIAVHAQPDFRLPSNRWILNPCASAAYPGQLLALENGRLAYAPAR
ncbi:MAG: hypothetical protein OXE48_07305 [Gammaproteobacteria bacterium]|nr:hypothetical protein [Gammaproteobacteria bacterium]